MKQEDYMEFYQRGQRLENYCGLKGYSELRSGKTLYDLYPDEIRLEKFEIKNKIEELKKNYEQRKNIIKYTKIASPNPGIKDTNLMFYEIVLLTMYVDLLDDSDLKSLNLMKEVIKCIYETRFRRFQIYNKIK